MITLAKLINNQTVIGDLHDDGTLTDTLMIQVMSNPQSPDQFNIMILPFFAPMSEEKVTLDADKIVTHIVAPENLKNEYIRITSGLILANPSDISNLSKVRPIFGKK